MLEKLWRKQKELSYTVGGTVNWSSHYGEQYGCSLKKLKIELPYDPVIPLLGIYPEKTIKRSKRCIYPNIHCSTIYNSQDMEHIYCIYICVWIYIYIYIHTVKYYSGMRKNKITPFAATWMGLDMIILRDVSQIEKDKHHLISLICGI